MIGLACSGSIEVTADESTLQLPYSMPPSVAIVAWRETRLSPNVTPRTMPKRTGHLRLGAFLYPSGHHIAAWRHPDSQADAGINFRHYVQLAQAAEAAKFDLIFLADGVGTRGDNLDFLSRTAHSYIAQFEPITLLSALAAVTTRIGRRRCSPV